MKKSICSSGFKDWPIEKVLEWASPLEVDGIEMWIGHINQFQEEQGPLDKLKNLFTEYGLEIPMISGYTNFAGGFSGERDVQQEFKDLKRLLDVARQLDCPSIRTFVGHISSRCASPEQWGHMVHVMKKVMYLADQYEVEVAVEIHYETFADNTEPVQMLMGQINHPRVKVIFDGANLNVERIDQLDALTVLYPWVKHIHLKNYKWDHSDWYKSKPVSILKGDIDNNTLISNLIEQQYGGYVSLEYFGDSRELNIKESLIELNKLDRSNHL